MYGDDHNTTVSVPDDTIATIDTFAVVVTVLNTSLAIVASLNNLVT